jgi:hypothetical protein
MVLENEVEAALNAAYAIDLSDLPEVEYTDDGERRWVQIRRQGVVVVEGYLEGPLIPGAITTERERIATTIEASCLKDGGIDGELCPSHVDAARIARNPEDHGG